jgi:CheY-like chemotaxis protein
MPQGTKILIIDDNENQCITLKKILEAKGYRVFTANKSHDAVELARREPPDLILLDLVFKGDKSGVEIFKDIRIIMPEVQAILITGHGPDEERRLLPGAWQEGIMDEMLRKPVEPEELIKAIEKHTK